jgi:hypothetical protein
MRKINYSTVILPADKTALLNNPPVSWLNNTPVKLEARKRRCHSRRQSSSFDFLLSSVCNKKRGNLDEAGSFFLLFFPSLIAILFLFFSFQWQTILTVDKTAQWRRHTTAPINRDKKRYALSRSHCAAFTIPSPLSPPSSSIFFTTSEAC